MRNALEVFLHITEFGTVSDDAIAGLAALDALEQRAERAEAERDVLAARLRTAEDALREIAEVSHSREDDPRYTVEVAREYFAGAEGAAAKGECR